ncbi:MAG: hypothetical protein QM811_17025 [Pirellulales bacterium]
MSLPPYKLRYRPDNGSKWYRRKETRYLVDAFDRVWLSARTLRSCRAKTYRGRRFRGHKYQALTIVEHGGTQLKVVQSRQFLDDRPRMVFRSDDPRFTGYDFAAWTSEIGLLSHTIGNGVSRFRRKRRTLIYEATGQTLMTYSAEGVDLEFDLNSPDVPLDVYVAALIFIAWWSDVGQESLRGD